MRKTIDDIVHYKKSLCKDCPFCLSRCLKCGSLNITVHMQNDDSSFKYINNTKNRIYLNRIKKRIFHFNIKRGIILSCNSCRNTLKSIDTSNSEYPELKTINPDVQLKFLHRNSKFHNHIVRLYNVLDGYSHGKQFDDWFPCESICLYFDELKIDKKGKCPVLFERVLDLKSRNKEYSKGKIKLRVNYLKEFKKFYTVISQTIYCRNPSA